MENLSGDKFKEQARARSAPPSIVPENRKTSDAAEPPAKRQKPAMIQDQNNFVPEKEEDNDDDLLIIKNETQPDSHFHVITEADLRKEVNAEFKQVRIEVTFPKQPQHYNTLCHASLPASYAMYLIVKNKSKGPVSISLYRCKNNNPFQCDIRRQFVAGIESHYSIFGNSGYKRHVLYISPDNAVSFTCESETSSEKKVTEKVSGKGDAENVENVDKKMEKSEGHREGKKEKGAEKPKTEHSQKPIGEEEEDVIVLD